MSFKKAKKKKKKKKESNVQAIAIDLELVGSEVKTCLREWSSSRAGLNFIMLSAWYCRQLFREQAGSTVIRRFAWSRLTVSCKFV